MTDEEKFKNCYKCGTKTENAPGIGLFCPNKECDVSDNLENVQWTFVKQLTEYEKGFEAGKKAALQLLPIESLDLTQKQVLLFNKDWDMKPYKVGEICNGKIMLIGGRIYYDYVPPTHWMPMPPAPEV